MDHDCSSYVFTEEELEYETCTILSFIKDKAFLSELSITVPILNYLFVLYLFLLFITGIFNSITFDVEIIT